MLISEFAQRFFSLLKKKKKKDQCKNKSKERKVLGDHAIRILIAMTGQLDNKLHDQRDVSVGS